MKPGFILFLLLLPAAVAVQAADTPVNQKADSAKSVSPSNDVSPFDKHPECMERSVDASSGKCIIQDGGTPRHLYPPKAPANSKAAAGSSSASKASTTGHTGQ